MRELLTQKIKSPSTFTTDREARKVILLIEDDLNLAAALAKFLESQDFEVVAVGDGLRGVEMATLIRPHLILCDLDLPIMDGFEVLSVLQTTPDLCDTPFLIITGRGHLKDMRMGMNMGADDYLVKPVPPEDLLTAVQTRLRLYNRRGLYRQRTRPNCSQVPDQSEEETRSTESGFVFLRTSNGRQRVAINEIEWIAASGEYSRVVWGGTGGILVRKALKSWEAELPNEYFLRVHRNTILNLRRLERIEKRDSTDMRAFLRGRPDPIEVSIRKVALLNRRLKTRSGHPWSSGSGELHDGGTESEAATERA